MNLEPIFNAARLSSILCREVQKYHIIENQKSGREPVTIADYGSQAIINYAIKNAFPDDAIMAEESGKQFNELVSDEQKQQISQLVSGVMSFHVDEAMLAEWLDYGRNENAERTWVVDPIDGTKGFLALRHYVIAIGVLEAGKPTAAVMAAPAYPGYEYGALLHALDNEAHIQPIRGEGVTRQIFASDITDPAKIRVLESVEKSHASQDRMGIVREYAGMAESQLERVDSQEKYARIAAGDGELYLRLPRLVSTRGHSTWDHASGVALLEAAGGRVTDVDGSELDFTTGRELSNNQGMIVSNGAIHDRVLEAVARLLEEEAEQDGE